MANTSARFGFAMPLLEASCSHRRFVSSAGETRKVVGSRAIELRQAAEIASLEQTIYETKERHAVELARVLQASGISTNVAFESGRDVCDALSGGGGPVLAVKRRLPCGQGRAVRLWVEDCTTLDIARVHAMDEVCGLRAHVDVPDRTLSAMLGGYRQVIASTGSIENTSDVDICLRVLLDAVTVHGPSTGGLLEIHLPSAPILAAAAAMAAVQQAKLPSELQTEAHTRLLMEANAHGGGSLRAPPRSPVPVAAGVPLEVRHSHPKPPQRRIPARPQSAPHGARRPQNAHIAYRDARPLSATAPLNWSAAECPAGAGGAVPQRRRARPTSAKALKHRRVIDDGVDSIIYEDVEEEELEAQTGMAQRTAVRPMPQRDFVARPPVGSRGRLPSARSETGAVYASLAFEQASLEDHVVGDPASYVAPIADMAANVRLMPQSPPERPQPSRPCRGRPQARWVCAPGGDGTQGAPRHCSRQDVSNGTPSTVVPTLGGGPRASSPPAPPRSSQAAAKLRESSWSATLREPSEDSGSAYVPSRTASIETGLIFEEA